MTPQLAWAKALGIDISKKKDTWRANTIIETGDEIPPGVYSSATDTRFAPSPNYLPQLLVGLLIGGASGVVAATLFDSLYLARARYGLPAPALQF
jgi:hypothetical protein